jgi:aldehyde:ferredoxin oxidoreductase
VKGSTGKMLFVDLGQRIAEARPIPEAWLKDYLGGEGLAVRLFYDLVHRDADPLDEVQPVIFASGPLTGTAAPCSGRCCVVFYSPATGTLGVANAGGHFAPALKRAGWDLLVVVGKADRPVYL